MPFFPFLQQNQWKKVHDVSVLGSNVALLVLPCIRGEFRPPSQHSAVSNLHRHGGKTAEESQKEKDYYRNPWQHTKGARYGSSELYSIHCSLSLLIVTRLITLPVLMKPIQSDSLLRFQIHVCLLATLCIGKLEPPICWLLSVEGNGVFGKCCTGTMGICRDVRFLVLNAFLDIWSAPAGCSLKQHWCGQVFWPANNYSVE